RKLKFICHWANPVKDFKWSNVPRVKLSSLSGSDDTFSRKLKFVCHWADPFKDLKWSNVPGIKLSSLSKSDDTFTRLQVLSNLHFRFIGFIDYFWSRKLNISNFGPADRDEMC
nr:hypothetical protein [Tanacetum cinerariifolium]